MLRQGERVSKRGQDGGGHVGNINVLGEDARLKRGEDRDDQHAALVLAYPSLSPPRLVAFPHVF